GPHGVLREACRRPELHDGGDRPRRHARRRREIAARREGRVDGRARSGRPGRACVRDPRTTRDVRHQPRRARGRIPVRPVDGREPRAAPRRGAWGHVTVTSRGAVKWAWIALGALLLGVLAWALWPTGTASDAQRAHHLATEIRCPDCESLSAADSQTVSARA